MIEGGIQNVDSDMLGWWPMSLLSDSEKVELLISILDNLIDQLPHEDSFGNYLETIRFFLKTKEPIIQKAAVSTSDTLIENVAYILRTQISLKQSVGALISTFDRVGYADVMDTAAVILKFEELREQMSAGEAKKVYVERWVTDNDELSKRELIEYLKSYFAELCLELQHDPADQFVQGKMEGVQHALKFVRMHMHARKKQVSLLIELS